MSKFELYVPRTHRAKPRRDPALTPAFALAALVFGLAFGATFVLDPATPAPEAPPAPRAAAPCPPTPLARNGSIGDGPARPAARRDRVARDPQAFRRGRDGDHDGRLVRIDAPADGGGEPHLDRLGADPGAGGPLADAGGALPAAGEAATVDALSPAGPEPVRATN